MKRFLVTISALSLVLVAGCGSSSSNNQPPNDPPVGLLSPVTDAATLEARLKEGLTTMSTADQLAFMEDAIAAGTPAPDANFTGTYTQEKNVDEFDAVRYDGSHLYVAPRRYFHCCFILAEAAPDAVTTVGTTPERSIRILATDPANGSATPAGEIPLEDNISVQGMYVEGDSLVALTAQSVYGSYGMPWADIAIWAPEEIGFRVYDVADKANPVLEVDARVDGTFVESRRIGNTVYIISRYTPWIDTLHYYVTDAAQLAENQQVLANTSLDDLLPKITINGTTSTLVPPDRCYVPTTDDDVKYPVLTTITAIPIDNPSNFSSTCYNEDAYGVYVSENALYFTELRPNTATSTDTTRIHKFALANTDVSYRGSVDIQGTVWRGGQADFRMSEHNGDLRVLASQFDWTNEDFVDHMLYVIREAAARPDLEIVGSLPNAQRPEEIGKPNERLFGVRFLGNRAYAVTFLQLDPLYVIDLADPTDPFIAGELEVTGFSDFLHPVNDALLLGLGQGTNGGIKLELFDVSDLSQPLSRGSTTLGGRGSWSEALYDRHAFTYQADINGVDRIAIPANLTTLDGSYTYLETGLYLFEIRDKDMPALAALNSVGSIIPPQDPAFAPYYSDRNRSFIHGDTVYYVRDEDVWAAFWQSPMVVNGPF